MKQRFDADALRETEALIDGLLTEARGALPPGSIPIRDLKLALFLAACGKCPEEFMDSSLHMNLDDWIALRDEALIKLEVADPDWEHQAEQLAHIRHQWLEKLHGAAPLAGHDEMANEIAVDLLLVLFNRHLDTNRSALGEKIEAAYLAGGWPCGWSGQFPSGRLCVYWPHD